MKFKKLIKTAAATLLAIAMVASVTPAVPAEAATYKAVTAKKSVKTISKTGKHVVVLPATTKKQYVQFKAPKAGTYTFEVTGITYDGEAEDVERDDYFTEWAYDYSVQTDLAPIVKGVTLTTDSIGNVHTLYGTVAAAYEVTIADLIAAVDANGYTHDDVVDAGISLGMHTSHSYKIKLAKGQKIQFVMTNTFAKQNKKEVQVLLQIKKK